MNQYLLAFGLALVISLALMPVLIPFLHRVKFGQSEREEGLASHKAKNGTPTMGGVVFVLLPILLLFVLDAQAFLNPEMQIVVLAYVGYALIGFIDDFIIVVQKDNRGLSPKMKFLMQSILAVLFFFLYQRIAPTTLSIPIVDIEIHLGWLYFVLIFLMFTAESNAVNLTDGLDGLSSGCVIISLAPIILFALHQGKSDLALFLVMVVGSLFGYLCFNLHPSKIFMGDTGSLALGGLLAASAMVMKKELLLVIIGGVFVMELLSVVIQVTSFKTRGKRVFKMAPLHHHFELRGYNETQVVIMFWPAALIFDVLGN